MPKDPYYITDKQLEKIAADLQMPVPDIYGCFTHLEKEQVVQDVINALARLKS